MQIRTVTLNKLERVAVALACPAARDASLIMEEDGLPESDALEIEAECRALNWNAGVLVLPRTAHPGGPVSDLIDYLESLDPLDLDPNTSMRARRRLVAVAGKLAARIRQTVDQYPSVTPVCR